MKSTIIPNWISKEFSESLSSQFFETSLGKIHYITGGKGAPIVFIHGNPTWSFLWRKVLNKVNLSSHQVFAPDLLNLGFSDALPANKFTMENHTNSLIEFVEGLDLKNITLVVQDWGGPLGLSMASKLSDRISGLVILNTGISAPKAPYRVSKFHQSVNKKVIPDILFRVFRKPMYGLHKAQADQDTIRGDVAKAYRYPVKINRRWGEALKFARMVPNGPSHPSFALFNEIEKYCRNFTGPIEVVWGTKDRILGRNLKKIKEIIPNANYTEVIAGHFLQEECPEEIFDAIARITKTN